MAASQVAFQNTPGDIRVPIFAAEVNAGPPSARGPSRQILLGRTLGVHAALALTPIIVGSSDPNAVAGLGSIGAEMIAYAREMNPLGEMWFVDVGDPSSGVKAVGAITIAGTPTQSGTLIRYIGGERYAVGVAAGDTKSIVAAALVAKINQGYVKFGRRLGAPVVASVDTTDTGKVVLTARHTGVEANDLRVEAGLEGDEIDPAGLTATVTQMTGGAGLPDMLAVLASLGAQAYDFITSPYATVADLNAARDFLSDVGTGRWAPLVGLDGHYITAKDGTLSELTTFGRLRNDRHATILGTNEVPNSPWCIVASFGGAIAFYKNLGRELATAIEIARPMQTIVLKGIRAPLDTDSFFGFADRDSLYRSGISALVFSPSGDAAIDRAITTYQTNAAGLPDTTFLDIEKIFVAAYVKRYMKQALLGTYPRHVLREDNPQSIQGVATPSQLRACVIHAYTQLSEDAGIVRQPDLFAQNLVVDADYDNDRANFYLPVSVSAALRVFAVNETIFTNLTDSNASGL